MILFISKSLGARSPQAFMKKGKLEAATALVLAMMAASPLGASETVTYSYDARGRLIQVSRSGTVNNGTQATYSYDRADNRTNVAVTTSGGSAPTLSIGNASVSEGGTLVFTVTKGGAAAGTVTVNYATANGTAVSGSDYTAASGTLTFAIADTSKTINVVTLDDAAVESAENMVVNLSGATGGATISTAQGTGTINDNDTPPAPTLAIGSASVTEGGNLIFTITKSGSASGSVSVNFATANGTATAGSDYTATSGTVTFAIADTTKTVTVVTLDDAAVESAETMVVNLSGATGGATISAAQGTGTINDNDVASAPSFSIADAAEYEGDVAVFTVTKTGSTSSSFSVNYATANNTAVAGSGLDYIAKSGTLTFAANETTKTISVTLNADQLVEGSESFLMNLSGATGGSTISDAQAIGTIYDMNEEGCFDPESGMPIPCARAPAPPPEPSAAPAEEAQ